MKTVVTVEEVCPNCGTTFAMDEVLQELRLKDGKAFYCPNGHGQHYTKSDASLINEKDAKISELELELADTKKEITRLKCEQLKTGKKNFIHRIFS